VCLSVCECRQGNSCHAIALFQRRFSLRAPAKNIHLTRHNGCKIRVAFSLSCSTEHSLSVQMQTPPFELELASGSLIGKHHTRCSSITMRALSFRSKTCWSPALSWEQPLLKVCGFPFTSITYIHICWCTYKVYRS
jgi:hypothetical protein